MAAEETKRLNVIIDADLHRELKIAVAKDGVTIAQFVADAIKEKLKGEK